MTPNNNLENEYWEKIRLNAPMYAIQKCEEAAKQIITLTTLLSAVYFGFIPFNEAIIPKIPFYTRFILLTPLPFWLVSLWLAIWTIVPKEVSYKPTEIASRYKQTGLEKYKKIQWSYILLIISMALLLVLAILFMIFFLPTP